MGTVAALGGHPVGVAAPRTIEVHRDVGSIEDEWDRLALQADASIFARPAWLRIWWEVFGAGELEILALREAGELVAVLPLTRTGSRLAAPVNEHTPLYDPPARDAGAAEALYAAVLGGRARRLRIAEIEARDTTTGALVKAAARHGWRLRVRPLRHAPYRRVTGSVGDYLASVSKDRRKAMRRRRRRLEEGGEVTIEWVDGSERLDELLDEGLAVEGSGWKAAAGTAINSRAETDRYYRAIAEWAASVSALELGFVRLDGRAIAFQLALWDETSCYALKAGFDPEFRKVGPGVLLLHDMIVRAHERRVETVELLGDATDFKLSWGPLTREVVRMQAFGPGLPGSADWLASSYVRPLLNKVTEGIRR